MTQDHVFILGGGVTGLAAGGASGLPVFEACETPGGICSSYYVRPGSTQRLPERPGDGDAYRFEIGGGHWIFGVDPLVLRYVRSLTPVKSYARLSSVYLHKQGQYVPYPLQNHLRVLGGIAAQALTEMAQPGTVWSTMKEWLECNFGPTLCRLFFFPFHELYTAGLYNRIAPQDAYKTPVNLTTVIQGALQETRGRSGAAAGYNVTFLYPTDGLNALAQRMASQCKILYGKRIARVDVGGRTIVFADGTTTPYRRLLTTLPLNRMMEMTGLQVSARPDPHTSVLVLNVGAVRGRQCPADHWLYNAETCAGFHRVGFYSNVDRSFLPALAQASGDRVSIYVEKAFVGGEKPTDEQVAVYAKAVVSELQDWGFISQAEVVDPTWIDVAYTWSWPGSQWKAQAMRSLEEHDIYPIGRYARWVFQGLSDSIRDGLYAGSSFRGSNG